MILPMPLFYVLASSRIMSVEKVELYFVAYSILCCSAFVDTSLQIKKNVLGNNRLNMIGLYLPLHCLHLNANDPVTYQCLDDTERKV